MKKSEKEILNNLSQRAEQFEMPVEDFVWDAIQNEVQPEKKKRRFGFWWIGVAGILAAVLIFIAGYEFNDANSRAEIDAEKEQPSNTSVLNTIPLITGAKVLHESTKRISLLQESALDSTKENTSFKNDVLHSNTNGYHSLNLPSISSSNTVSNSFINNQSIQNNSGIRISQTTEIDSDGIEVAANVEVVSEIDQGDLSNSIVTDSQVERIINKDSVNIISQIVDIVDLDTSSVRHNENDPVVLDTPIEEQKKESKFTLLLHGGVGESFRVLKSEIHHDLIEHKNNNETFGGCFEVGLDAQFKLSNRFIGRTGIGYKFYSDKYDFQHELISHTTRNDYQYFQIPVTLGFNILPRPRSNLYLLGGMRLNLLASAQSSWVDVNLLAPVAHSNASANTPFRSITGAVNLGLDYNFNISDKFSIHIIPSVDAFLNSLYKRTTDLDQRPYSFNIDLGVSYNF